MTRNECVEILKTIKCNEHQQEAINIAIKAISNWENIMNDIEIYESDCNLSCNNKTCKSCNQITFSSIRKIINKHLSAIIKGEN